MRLLHELWRHLTGDKINLNNVKGALIYLGVEVVAIVLLVALTGLLGSLISRLF